MTGLAQVDITRMRDQLFFEGPERNRRLSRFWLLLPLAAVIASAGVVSDSTATVIGAGAGKLLHRKTASKLEEQAGATIPAGGAGLIVAYPHSAAGKVEPAVTRAINKAVGEAEGHHVQALKGAIADAQQKMAESGA